MDPKNQPQLNSLLPKGRFTKLLVLLLGMLVLAPLLEEFFHLLLLEDLFLTAVIIYATYACSRNKVLLIVAVCLALPAVALTWLSLVVDARWLAITGGLCDVAYIATIIVTILAYIFQQKDVRADMIAGAIVAYLLIAVMWAQIYSVLENIKPGHFSFPAGTLHATKSLLRYFSLVTITTVGYGDITPVTSGARAFANLEAVVGQLYLVILVAWLVGMHVSVKSKI